MGKREGERVAEGGVKMGSRYVVFVFEMVLLWTSQSF